MGELNVGQAVPGACAREGKEERERFCSVGEEGMIEGYQDWADNLDHSWSREEGGSMSEISGNADGMGRLAGQRGR